MFPGKELSPQFTCKWKANRKGPSLGITSITLFCHGILENWDPGPQCDPRKTRTTRNRDSNRSLEKQKNQEVRPQWNRKKTRKPGLETLVGSQKTRKPQPGKNRKTGIQDPSGTLKGLQKKIETRTLVGPQRNQKNRNQY